MKGGVVVEATAAKDVGLDVTKCFNRRRVYE